MKTSKTIEFPKSVCIQNSRGKRLEVELTNEGGEMLGIVYVDEIPYHVFYASRKEIGKGGNKFVVDRDPGYQPRLTSSDKCLLIAPYSK
jgi:hypothetical protein